MPPYTRLSPLLPLAIATLGAAAVAAPAGAQAASSATTAAGVTLRARQRVRVHTTHGTRVRGRLLYRTLDTLVLSAPTLRGQRAVAWTAVDTLWVQHGSAAVPVGLVGAAALGTFAGIVVHGFSGGDYGPECRGACVVQGAAVGAGVGFLVGAAIGSLVPRWRRQFPASSPRGASR